MSRMAMSTRIIAELGSCHNSKLDRIKEAIDKAKALDLYAIKLQLFPNDEKYTSCGNVYLSPELFTEAYRYGESVGMPVTASTFDMWSYYFLRTFNPLFIKFSYGKKEERHLIEDSLSYKIETIVSCDVMTSHLVPKEVVKLYCVPEYPVRFELAFDDLFNGDNIYGYKGSFDGFSDHTLGTRQTQRAIDAGAQFIEKHVKLGYDDETCPDARFAINIQDLALLRR